MENEYKLGLIGAIFFTIFAFVFYLNLNTDMIKSGILALLFSLVITLLLSKKVDKK
jgi:hypothetical protein